MTNRFSWADWVNYLYSRSYPTSDREPQDSGKRGTFYRIQEPRKGFIDARDTIRSVPIITTLGGVEDRQEQQLFSELEHAPIQADGAS